LEALFREPIFFFLFYKEILANFISPFAKQMSVKIEKKTQKTFEKVFVIPPRSPRKKKLFFEEILSVFQGPVFGPVFAWANSLN
jgi:hypothetical protein